MNDSYVSPAKYDEQMPRKLKTKIQIEFKDIIFQIKLYSKIFHSNFFISTIEIKKLHTFPQRSQKWSLTSVWADLTCTSNNLKSVKTWKINSEFKNITVLYNKKKVQFQKCTKPHFWGFQKWQKINFCTRRKV